MSIDHATFASLERRLKDLEHWVLVVRCGNLGAVQDQIIDLEERTAAIEGYIQVEPERTLDLQTHLTWIQERIAALEQDIIADKQPAEPAPPRCCICGDRPETAFTQPLPCPDCGRHPQPAEVVDAISLLMRCVPILDVHVSQNNDGRRLRSAICDFLADKGYPGWREARCPAEEALTFGSALQLGDLIRSYTFTPAEAYEINKLVTSRVR